MKSKNDHKINEYRKKIEIFRTRYSDFIELPTTQYEHEEYDKEWAETFKDKVGFPLTDSYLWFLNTYIGGYICGDEIYSIYCKEFESLPGGDIAFQYFNTRDNFPEIHSMIKNGLVVFETGFDETFYFNYDDYDGSECSIWLLDRGEHEYFTSNFYEFLIKYIQLCI